MRSRPGIGGGMPDHVDQLALFAAHADGLEAAFLKFHADNPHVYRLLVRFSREAKASGLSHFGIKAVWERMRWYQAIETKDPTNLKLNNNWPSRYARLLMARERCTPLCSGCRFTHCLAGFFATRELQTPTNPDALRSRT